MCIRDSLGEACAGTVSLDPANNPYPTLFAGGSRSQGIIPGRPLEVLALELGRTSFSPTINPWLSHERTIELNDSFDASEIVQIQTVMQWINNPGGQVKVPGIWAGGVQINLSL